MYSTYVSKRIVVMLYYNGMSIQNYIIQYTRTVYRVIHRASSFYLFFNNVRSRY